MGFCPWQKRGDLKKTDKWGKMGVLARWLGVGAECAGLGGVRRVFFMRHQMAYLKGESRMGRDGILFK